MVGADGLIGRELSARLVLAGKQVVETTRQSDTVAERRIFLDLSENISNWSPPCHISVAYICAAVSSIEYCRKYATQSAVVNIHNTVELAKILVKRGTFVIFPSTNLVYDGSVPFRKADDSVCPTTEYGRQKAEAERQLLLLGKLISVVRFTKILSFRMPLFEGWIKALKKNEVIHPFSDMVMAPVRVDFAVDVLCRVGEVSMSGILQVSGNKDITYEQVAKHLAAHAGCQPSLVQPVKFIEAYPDAEAVTIHTTLDTNRLNMELKMKTPNIWLSIGSVVDI